MLYRVLAALRRVPAVGFGAMVAARLEDTPEKVADFGVRVAARLEDTPERVADFGVRVAARLGDTPERVAVQLGEGWRQLKRPVVGHSAFGLGATLPDPPRIRLPVAHQLGASVPVPVA